jgi:surface antigen
MTHRPAFFVFSLVLGIQVSAAGAGNSLVDMVSNTGLAPSDFTAMENEARKLYDPLKPIGTVQRWTNSETGSVGEVTLKSVQNNCVELMHNVQQRGKARDFRYRAWRCQSADGRWLLDTRPN